MTLLDTSVVSNFLDQRAAERYPKLVEFVTTTTRGSGMFIAFVTQYEIRRGLEVLRRRRQGRRKMVSVERFLDTVVVLGLDERSGEGWNVAARLWAEAKVQEPSVVMSEGDLLIAATALFHGHALATSDERLARALAKVRFAMPVHVVPPA